MAGVRGWAGVGRVEAGCWMLDAGCWILDVGRWHRFCAIVKSVPGDDFVDGLHIGCTRICEQGRRGSAFYSAQIMGSHVA